MKLHDTAALTRFGHRVGIFVLQGQLHCPLDDGFGGVLEDLGDEFLSDCILDLLLQSLFAHEHPLADVGPRLDLEELLRDLLDGSLFEQPDGVVVVGEVILVLLHCREEGLSHRRQVGYGGVEHLLGLKTDLP